MGFNLLQDQLIQAGTRRRKSFVILGNPHPRNRDTYYVIDYDTDQRIIFWTKNIIDSLVIRGYAREVFEEVREISQGRVRLVEI